MNTGNLFNYESKELANLSTRIPKEFKELLKIKATIEGMSIQDLVIYLIGNYVTNSEGMDIAIDRMKNRASKILI